MALLSWSSCLNSANAACLWLNNGWVFGLLSLSLHGLSAGYSCWYLTALWLHLQCCAALWLGWVQSHTAEWAAAGTHVPVTAFSPYKASGAISDWFQLLLNTRPWHKNWCYWVVWPTPWIWEFLLWPVEEALWRIWCIWVGLIRNGTCFLPCGDMNMYYKLLPVIQILLCL